MNRTFIMSRVSVIASLAALTLSGCATFRAAAPGDPLEPINRGVYSFNNTFDHYLLKPIARGYEAVVPNLVKTGISNVFQNAADAQSVVPTRRRGARDRQRVMNASTSAAPMPLRCLCVATPIRSMMAAS